METFVPHPEVKRADVVSGAAKPNAPSERRVTCRKIEEGDLDALANLFANAFRASELERKKLAFLQQRRCPVDFPRFGYLLDMGGEAVGAILLIVSASVSGNDGAVRGSVSNWYVRPDYQAYAPMLVSRALSDRRLTYVNASARAAIWPIIEAQGFRRISDGVFVTVPSLAGIRQQTKLIPIGSVSDLPPGLPSAEADALLDHARAGCFSFVCMGNTGPVPIIIGRRPLFGNRIPAGHLIYARTLEDFVDVAGPLGRHLLTRGIPIVLVYGNGPVAGLTGRYFRGRMPKFARGTNPPPLTDLTYTNIALFNAPEHIRLLTPITPAVPEAR